MIPRPQSNGSNTPTSSAFFYHLRSKRPRFRRSGRSEKNTGSSEFRQNLNNWIKITYFSGAWNVLSWAAILKFAVSVKSGTKIAASSPGSSRFPMRGLWGRGWNLSSPRIFQSFRISNHPSTFIISRLLSFHSPQNLKLQNVVRTLQLYLITSFQHFWTTHVNATGSRTFSLSGLK